VEDPPHDLLARSSALRRRSAALRFAGDMLRRESASLRQLLNDLRERFRSPPPRRSG
jgi:hypothetical protein